MKKRYYLLEVEGGVEPSVRGPFKAEERQSSEARRIHERLAEDDCLLWADVDEVGDLTVGPYTAKFFLAGSPENLN